MTCCHSQFLKSFHFNTKQLKAAKSVASSGICAGLVIAIVAMLCGGAVAQSGCPAVFTGFGPMLEPCTRKLNNPIISQLAIVVQASPKCLCSVINGGGSTMAIVIYQTLALSFPVAVKFKIHCSPV